MALQTLAGEPVTTWDTSRPLPVAVGGTVHAVAVTLSQAGAVERGGSSNAQQGEEQGGAVAVLMRGRINHPMDAADPNPLPLQH